MFNNVIGKLDNFFSDAGQGQSMAGGNGGGSHPPTSGGSGEQRPEDIPREELLHLCMKMNARMKTMEGKYKELSRKKATLVNERTTLLQHLETILQTPLMAPPTTSSTNGSMAGMGSPGGADSAGSSPSEQDLDLAYIQRKVAQFQDVTSATKQSHDDRVRQFERELMELQNKNALLTAMMNSNAANKGKNDDLIDVSDAPSESSTAPVEEGSGKVNTTALVELNNSLQQQLVTMQMDNKDYQSKLQRFEMEQERLKNIEIFLKEQLKTMEIVIIQKNQELETINKEKQQQKLQLEEKIVYLQMQVQQIKQQRDETLKRIDDDNIRLKNENESLLNKMKILINQKEEKDILISSNKEMMISLQQRLLEIEPELVHYKERCNELERNIQVSKIMKLEQDTLLQALQKDMKSLYDEKDKLLSIQQDNDDYHNKYDQLQLKLTSLQDKCNKLQDENDEKNATIIRLRSEASVTDRNYAMKTAMLATCEAQLEEFQKDINNKDLIIQEITQNINNLMQQVSSTELRLKERVDESNELIQQLENKLLKENEQNQLFIESLKQEQLQNIENVKKDYAKKSAMARQLLSEREEEVRILSNKVKELQDEISSGAPTDRKILELAKEQSKRDAMNVMHRDNREVAFQQLQRSLASKDFELAQCQQRVSDLNNEVADLRKIKQREGINMDYLKNVVFQYMTLSAQSSERQALVPVLAMLLQFNAKEMGEVQKALKDPNYGLKPVKEVKRVDFSNLFSFGSTSTSEPASPARSPGIVAMPPSPVPGSIKANPPAANTTRPPLPPSLRLPKEEAVPPSSPLRKTELSLSDQDLHQKLTKIGGDILDMSMSNDEIDSQSQQSMLSPHDGPEDGFFSKAL